MSAVLRAGRHAAPASSPLARLLLPVADFFTALPGLIAAEFSYAWEWLLHGWPEPVDKAPRARLPVQIAPELPVVPLVPAPRGGTLPGMQIPGYLARRH
ncbi:MAG TPA: hypothetical protein VK599_17760 [Streptosporangiaceae bacterium]|nr:hypothetical protein [Streptosporangiaceae bacterium]